MGRLVDLDDVLAIPMGRRAKEMVMALNSKPAIIYDFNALWTNDKGIAECKALASILLYAFRYGVNRHPTQALFRPDEHCVIEQNLDLMCDDFIRQMIDGIHQEYWVWECRKEADKTFEKNPHYLQPMLDKLQEEYEKRTGRRIEYKAGVW